MDLPLRHDITIPQRATFRERIQLPIDCTDREVVAQVWSGRNGQRHQKALDLEVDWIDRAVTLEIDQGDGTTAEVVYGDFYLVGDWSETAEVTLRDGLWDLLVIDGESLATAGERTYWLEGIATINPGMSEEPEVTP